MKKGTAHFLLYLSCLIMIAVLAAELIIIPRMFKLPRESLLNGFAAIPGTDIDGDVINAMGFTGDVINREKPANTVRILTLGGSTMFNFHMTERLKTSIQSRTNKRIELVGAGLRTHTTRSDVFKMKLLADYQFDYVLIYNGINDLWANNVLPEYYQDDYSHLNTGFYYRNFLLDNSLIARLITLVWSSEISSAAIPGSVASSNPDPQIINASNFRSIRSMQNNLQEIITIAKDHHTKPLLMTFAFHIQTPADEGKQTGEHLWDNWPTAMWGSAEFINEGLLKTNDMIRTLAKSTATPVIDVDQAMSSDINFFWDVCHFNDHGIDEFTNLVSNYFSQEKLL